MSGLLGVIADPSAGSIGSLFDAVLAGVRRHDGLHIETCVDEARHYALGRVHLGVLQAAPQLPELPGGRTEQVLNSRVHVLFHGDLHNTDEIRALLPADPSREPQPAAALVGALYCQDRHGFASHLKGAFVAAILDHGAGELRLLTDRLGAHPLYWFNTADRFVFASELHAALRAHPRPTLNARTVVDLLELGFPMGEETLAAGVELLPPGSVLIYRWRDRSVRLDRYAELADSFQPGPADRKSYLENVTSAFSTAMERAVVGSHRYGLSLSGGLDTRVILSALDRLEQRVSTFTLGGRGCADEVIAATLARIAGSTHRFVALDNGYLKDLLPPTRRMSALTDGVYVSHGFTEVRALQAFEDSDIEVLLRGHLGELAKTSTAWPFHTDAAVHAATSPAQLLPILLERFGRANGASPASDFFTDRFGPDVEGRGARRSLEAAVAELDLPMADRCSYLYLRHYHRRVTIPSLEIFRSATEVRLPLADQDFLDAVLGGPAAWRNDTSIHQALIAANKPEYLRVRNTNTGAPAGAGPLQEVVLDKVNTILRRLNVYGYRHYHAFDGWMRNALLDVVGRVLLDEETLSRGVFQDTTLRATIDRARQGDTQHDHLLQALVNVELWQRDNL